MSDTLNSTIARDSSRDWVNYLQSQKHVKAALANLAAGNVAAAIAHIEVAKDYERQRD